MTNQVAITMLKNLEQSLDDYCELNDEGKTAFSMAITALELFGISEQLPSVQPELANNSKELDKENGELISRQAAIDAVEFGITYAKAFNKSTGEAKELFKESNKALNEVAERLKDLPSAQPEIIRCKDCKNYYFADNRVPSEQSWVCDAWGIDQTAHMGYCFKAERKEE